MNYFVKFLNILQNINFEFWFLHFDFINIMSNNKKIKKTDLSVAAILIIGIFVVVNFLSYQIFYRFDLTQNKIYSISSVSKKTVGELDDVVNIKAYFSNNLPSQFLALRQEVADILDEYQAFSNGKIRIEFIDPGTEEDTQRELYMVGIPQLTFEVYEKDKIQQVRGYMGIVISYGENSESIPAVKQNTSDLEYQLTTVIKKVISDKIAAIGIVTSHGTADSQNQISTIYQELSGLYTLQNIDLQSITSVPDNIDTIIIIGPREQFTEEQLKVINSFVARGGGLLLAYNGVEIGDGLQAQKNITGIEGLMEKYGIKINNDLVADQRSGIASFNQGFITFSTQYPFWPKVIGDGDFISDGFLRNSPDNLVFFQNLVDMLSLDGDLISIRSKTVSSRPIKEDLTDSSRAMIRYINVFGLTMVVVVFGMIRYYIRRKSRFVDDL